jgi:hypothetical protein
LLLSFGGKGGGEGDTHITALCAKEVSSVPLSATRNNDLALDRGLAALAPRAEELMVIQVAVEPQAFVAIVFSSAARSSIVDMMPGHTVSDPVDAVQAVGLGLRVEGHAFETLAAVVAAEAFGVEAGAGRADDAACDGEGAVGAECARAPCVSVTCGRDVCVSVDATYGGGCCMSGSRSTLGCWQRTSRRTGSR